LGVRLLELKEHLVRTRPTSKRDALDAVEKLSSRTRSTTRIASDRAPYTSEDLREPGKPQEKVREVGNLERHLPRFP